MNYIKWIILGVLLSFPVQAQPEAAPPKLKCVPVGTLPVNIQITEIMTDNDGDRWVMIRNRGTGTLMIGFVQKNATFCQIGEGKTARES